MENRSRIKEIFRIIGDIKHVDLITLKALKLTASVLFDTNNMKELYEFYKEISSHYCFYGGRTCEVLDPCLDLFPEINDKIDEYLQRS